MKLFRLQQLPQCAYVIRMRGARGRYLMPERNSSHSPWLQVSRPLGGFLNGSPSLPTRKDSCKTLVFIPLARSDGSTCRDPLLAVGWGLETYKMAGLAMKNLPSVLEIHSLESQWQHLYFLEETFGDYYLLGTSHEPHDGLNFIM